MNKKEDKEKLVLQKESALIESSRESLTLIQQQTYNMLLLNAALQLYEDPNLQKFSIQASIILDYYDIGKNYAYLKKELKKLEQVIIEYNLLNKDKTWTFGAFPLLSSFEYNHGTIIYQLPFQIKDRILEHKIYATFGLFATRFFHSKYTLALYELLMDYMNSPEIPAIDFEIYKKLVGAKNKRYHTYELIDAIVKKPVEDLNNNMYVPFNVSYRLIRGVRDKIEAIKFEIELRDWYKKRFYETIIDISPEAKEITSQLPERFQNSLSATVIQGLINEYGLDKVKEAYEKVKQEEGFIPARMEQYLKEKYLTKQKSDV
jgi:hypothetical protein